MRNENNECAGETLSPCPKELLKLISNNPVFKLILLERPTNEEFATIPLTPLKSRSENYLPSLFGLIIAALVNLLLALAEVDPKTTANDIPLASILAAYQSSLSVCGKLDPRRSLHLVFRPIFVAVNLHT